MKQIPLWPIAILAVAGCQQSSGSSAELKELTERVDKLEAAQKDVAEMQAFLQPIMKQRRDEEKRRAASEPDPNARFAVDITGNNVHGPAGAAVTIVEAWDFA